MEKDSIKWNGILIEYEWTRGKRKTIGISISPDGGISVKAPLEITKEQIRQCMLQKGRWIVQKKKEIEQRQRERKVQNPDRHFEEGDFLSYLGQQYVLRKKWVSSINGKQRNDNLAQIKRLENEREICLIYTGSDWTEADRKDVLEQWYREEARKYLTERVKVYSRRIPCEYGRIFIKNQKTCWGSCSTKGNLNFNWRIMMAPAEIIDYLVVHELCHRIEMNHSDAFWKLVEKQLPDYKERRQWLKENGHLLVW